MIIVKYYSCSDREEAREVWEDDDFKRGEAFKKGKLVSKIVRTEHLWRSLMYLPRKQ